MLLYNDKAGKANLQKNLGIAASILSEGIIEQDWILRKSPFSSEVENDNILMKQSEVVKIQTGDEMNADTDGEIYLHTPLDIGIKHSQMTFISDTSI